MILLAVAGQAADLASYLMPGVVEVNPLVAALGWLAVPAKLALVAFLVFLGLRFGADWRVRAVLALACAAGVVGFAANIGLLSAA